MGHHRWKLNSKKSTEDHGFYSDNADDQEVIAKSKQRHTSQQTRFIKIHRGQQQARNSPRQQPAPSPFIGCSDAKLKTLIVRGTDKTKSR